MKAILIEKILLTSLSYRIYLLRSRGIYFTYISTGDTNQSSNYNM
jgi:hypothetical protein